MTWQILARRTGKTAQARRRRDEFIRAMGKPVIGLDVAGCGCLSWAEATADPQTQVITVRDLKLIPCKTHENGES